MSRNTQYGFLCLLLLFIYCVPIYWLFTDNSEPVWSEAEGRNLPGFPQLSLSSIEPALKQLVLGRIEESGKIYFSQFLSNQYQISVERAFSQHFPLRNPFLYLSKSYDRTQINLAYLFLPDQAIPADLTSGLYVLRDRSMIIPGPSQFTAKTILDIKARIDCYDELIAKNPDKNYYAYYIEEIGQSIHHPLNAFFQESDKGQGFRYFSLNKPEALRVEKWTFSSLEDYREKHFRTDHHWNVFGALDAYDTIYMMLSQNYSQISPSVDHDEILVFPGIQFLGSRARQTLYPITPDDFAVAVVNLPQYLKYIDGVLSIEDSEKYLSGEYNTSKYFNHYGLYYGYGNPGLIEYDFENNSDRNLLIIGNSYKKAIHLLIASHYNHTYSVDLRSYGEFSFSDFINKYPVDDVLFIGDSTVIFLNSKWCVRE